MPFEITPQIHRYLKELSDFYDDFYVEETNKTFILHTYKNEEKPTDKSENNIFDFVEYFQEIGALDASGKSPLEVMPASETNLDKGLYYVEYYTLKIRDIKPIRELLKKIEGNRKSADKKSDVSYKDIERLILMDGEGDFTIGKHKDPILFKSKKAGYYKVFVAIYKITGGIGGKASYKKISEHIRLHLGGGKELSMKQIQNHINNSIKRLYLPKETPDGKEILSADSEGKAIIFYNPVVG